MDKRYLVINVLCGLLAVAAIGASIAVLVYPPAMGGTWLAVGVLWGVSAVFVAIPVFLWSQG